MKGDYLPPGDGGPGGVDGDPTAGPTAAPTARRWPGGRGPVIELLPPPDLARPPAAVAPPRWGRALLLFTLTFLTTTTLGAVWLLWAHPTALVEVFPWLSPHTVATVWTDPANLRLGLSFAAPALFILLCHEMGHYLTCRFYGLPATLPYFLPVPLGIGTLGAFIRIHAPIDSRRQLFDVGVAGPLAGFAALLPFLILGVAWSQPYVVPELDPAVAERVIEEAAAAGTLPDVGMLLAPGRCLAIEGVSRLFHGDLPPGTRLHLHPFALAAWFGLLVTALNLLPLGQLDGGHVLYAAVGRLQHRLALPLWLGLGLAGFYWPGWLLWFVIVLLMGLRHPPVRHEAKPLGPGRRALAWLALVIFVLSFMPIPVEEVFLTVQ